MTACGKENANAAEDVEAYMPGRWKARSGWALPSAAAVEVRAITTGGTIACTRRWRDTRAFYGLKPIGPHRRMADELLTASRQLRGLREPGLRDVNGGASWSMRRLPGLGDPLTGPATEIAEIRRRVLDAFPDAAADPVPEFATAPLAYDLSRGESWTSQPRVLRWSGSRPRPRWSFQSGMQRGPVALLHLRDSVPLVVPRAGGENHGLKSTDATKCVNSRGHI